MEAVDQGGTRSGGKRRPSPTAGDGKRKKRRFVWGDDLHAAFQTAIFDVGLRAATVHAVAGELPAVAPGEHLDAATVEAQLAAFRRQRPAAGGAGPPRPSAGDSADAAAALDALTRGAALAERSVEDALEANDALRQTLAGRARRSSASASCARRSAAARRPRRPRRRPRRPRRRPRRPRRRPRRPRRRPGARAGDPGAAPAPDAAPAAAPAAAPNGGLRPFAAAAQRLLAGPPPPPSPAAPLSPFTTLTARLGAAAPPLLPPLAAPAPAPRAPLPAPAAAANLNPHGDDMGRQMALHREMLQRRTNQLTLFEGPRAPRPRRPPPGRPPPRRPGGQRRRRPCTRSSRPTSSAPSSWTTRRSTTRSSTSSRTEPRPRCAGVICCFVCGRSASVADPSRGRELGLAGVAAMACFWPPTAVLVH